MNLHFYYVVMEVDGVYELDINPKKVCRLCLSQPATLTNIYSQTIVDGYILSIPQILQFTVDISVNEFFHLFHHFSVTFHSDNQ